MPFRFLQTSDLHLGSRLTASSLRLPAAKADLRRRELQSVLTSICALARDEQVDALLIPGDLFDDESVPFEEIGFAIETFGNLGRPVVIAPGNHDYSSPSSFYCPEFLLARYGLRWPPNVFIFQRQRWEELRLPGLPGVCLLGLAFETHVPLCERLLQQARAGDDGVTLLLFHGSRLQTVPPGKLMTLPFSDAELRATGCIYAAIGHYHEGAAIEAEGRIIGAYSGCPAGRGLDECGRKSVLLGEIDADRQVWLRPVQVDPRAVVRVEVECSGALSNASLQQRIEETVCHSGARDVDIVCIVLTGRLHPDLSLHLPERLLADSFFHCVMDASGLRPDYDLNRLAEEAAVSTTEGRFVRRLLEDLRMAEAAGDVERARTLRAAIEYGLDALRGVPVAPRVSG